MNPIAAAIAVVVALLAPARATQCSGTQALTLGSTALRISDGQANYTANMNCTWSVTSPPGTRIRFEVAWVRTELGHDFVHVFDESGLLEKFSGNVAPPLPILSSGPRMRIVFTSDDSVNQDGFAATLTMVGAGTWSPTRVPTRDPTRSPTRLPRSPTTSAPTPSPSVIPSARPSLAPTQPTQRPSRPTPTPTLHWADALTDAHALRPCSGMQALMLDSRAVNITITEGPANYSANMNCTWVVTSPPGTRIQINFTSFSTELDHDYVLMFDGNGLLGRHSGKAQPGLFVSAGSSMRIVFTSDQTIDDSGFVAQLRVFHNTSNRYSAINVISPPAVPISLPSDPRGATPPSRTACNGMVVLTLGSTPLTISDGPGDYTRSMNCSWLITAPDEFRIRIVFTSFSTAEFQDHVIVYAGGSTVPLPPPKRLFGQSIPAPVTSSGPNMLVVFVSDNSHHAQGFEATLSLVRR